MDAAWRLAGVSAASCLGLFAARIARMPAWARRRAEIINARDPLPRSSHSSRIPSLPPSHRRPCPLMHRPCTPPALMHSSAYLPSVSIAVVCLRRWLRVCTHVHLHDLHCSAPLRDSQLQRLLHSIRSCSACCIRSCSACCIRSCSACCTVHGCTCLSSPPPPPPPPSSSVAMWLRFVLPHAPPYILRFVHSYDLASDGGRS